MHTHTPHTPAPASPAHTPEPWRVAIHAPAGLVKIEADKIVVADTIRNEANATRLVACVNACAGMTDPAQEIAALRARSNNVPAMCAEVEKQRAEIKALRDALEGLLADKYLADPINADRMAPARAALAIGGEKEGK